jgi:hypothetical protein
MKKPYAEKLAEMWEFCNDTFTSPEDLTTFLEISIEDLINLFPDRLVDMHPRIFVRDIEERDDLNEDDESEAWEGYGEEEPLWDDSGTEEDLWDETEKDN